jgi:hypothetical protein
VLQKQSTPPSFPASLLSLLVIVVYDPIYTYIRPRRKGTKRCLAIGNVTQRIQRGWLLKVRVTR